MSRVSSQFEGIRDANLRRSWQQYHDPVDVEKSLDESLERMQLDYGTCPVRIAGIGL